MYVVVDTVSLVNLCFVDLGGFRVIKWLVNEFSVLITTRVYLDGLAYIEQSDDQEAHDIYTTNLAELQYDQNSCNEYVEEILYEDDRFENIDEGEETALSLSLRMSMLNSSYVILITDDYRALNPLGEILKDHGIGVAVTGFYIIRQIGMLNSRQISVEEIEIASRSFLNQVRDNKKPAHIEQKPDKIFSESAKRINKLRGKGAARSKCRN